MTGLIVRCINSDINPQTWRKWTVPVWVKLPPKYVPLLVSHPHARLEEETRSIPISCCKTKLTYVDMGGAPRVPARHCKALHQLVDIEKA